jgi:hypothetical protein
MGMDLRLKLAATPGGYALVDVVSRVGKLAIPRPRTRTGGVSGWGAPRTPLAGDYPIDPFLDSLRPIQFDDTATNETAMGRPARPPPMHPRCVVSPQVQAANELAHANSSKPGEVVRAHRYYVRRAWLFCGDRYSGSR